MYRTKIKKNKLYSKVWRKNELKKISYDYLIYNKLVKINLKRLLTYQKMRCLGKYYKTRLVNYCIISERPGWVFKKIYYSRQNFKEAVTKGTFMGIRKACW